MDKETSFLKIILLGQYPLTMDMPFRMLKEVPVELLTSSVYLMTHCQ